MLTDTCPEFARLLLTLLKSHESIVGESAGNTAVHEMLLSEVRLFTKEAPLDSITVSRKLVDDVQFLMDCFRCVSNEQCFQFPCASRSPNKSKGRRKVKESGSVIQNFPSWFSNAAGCTIYQWIEAFFEHLIMKRYQIMSIEGEAALFECYMSLTKKLFKEHNDLCAFWEGADRPRLIQHLHTSLGRSEDQCFAFLLYAALNAAPAKFVDSLCFAPLNSACNFGAHVGLAHGKTVQCVLEAVKTQCRECVAMQLVEEEEGEKGEMKGKSEENVEVEVEVYDEKHWTSFALYKYFFDEESIAECLVLLSKENFEKAVHKKRKAKKPTSSHPASPVKEKDGKIQKPKSAETKCEEPKAIKEPAKEATIEKVDAPKPARHEIPSTPANKVAKSKKKKRNKAIRLADKKAVEEYEDLKERTFKLFAKLTNSALPPKKNPKPKKSSKNTPKTKKSNNKDKESDCLSCQCGTTASHISEFITDNEDSHFCEEKLLLAPYVGSSFEAEFFSHLNAEIEVFMKATAEHNKLLKQYAHKLQQTIVNVTQQLFPGICSVL